MAIKKLSSTINVSTVFNKMIIQMSCMKKLAHDSSSGISLRVSQYIRPGMEMSPSELRNTPMKLISIYVMLW